jgi:phenylalanine-4-hydroxylase
MSAPHSPSPEEGLTTTRAAFIEEAKAHGEIYIHQPYELYSPENHATWARLISRMHDRWERFANHRYLEGLETLHLPSDRVPRLDDVNRFMKPLTGFVARPVSGYVPSYVFFDCLRRPRSPRASVTSTSACAGSRATSGRWRASSGSRSNSG